MPQANSHPRTRVLILNSSVSGGGAGKQLIHLVKSFDRNKIKTIVVIPFDGVVGEALRDAGVEVRYHRLLPERFGTTYLKIPSFLRGPILERIINLCLFPSIIKDLKTVVRELNIDVIYGNHLIQFPIAIGLGRATEKPVIIHSREIVESKFENRLYKWLSSSPVVKKVVCSSQGSSRTYQSLGKNRIIHDCLAISDHIKNVKPCLRKEFNLSNEHLVFGFMGRLVEWKGVPLLIEAFALVAGEYSNARLVIVGGNNTGARRDFLGDYKTLVKDLALEDQVIFPGFKKDPRPYAADFDVAVLPSIKPEPFGMVIIESMAFGIPPLVSGHGGAVEIVEDGVTGLYFEPGNREDLAAKMKKLLVDRKYREQLGAAAAKDVAQRFDISNRGNIYTDVVMEVA